MKRTIKAQWFGTERVNIYNASGLLISHVGRTPQGWKVFPHGTNGVVSRKGHGTPEGAIKSYYAKSVHVFPEVK